MRNRKLDQGNPGPGNLGSDFGIFGASFWPEVQRLDPGILRGKGCWKH